MIMRPPSSRAYKSHLSQNLISADLPVESAVDCGARSPLVHRGRYTKAAEQAEECSPLRWISPPKFALINPPQTTCDLFVFPYLNAKNLQEISRRLCLETNNASKPLHCFPLPSSNLTRLVAITSYLSNEAKLLPFPRSM